VLRLGEPAVLLLAHPVLRQNGLELAARIAAKTGCRLLAQTFNRRMERGAGRISIDRIPYPVDQALKTLEGVKHIVLVGSRIPVAFFAYPDKPSLLAPKDTQFTTLSTLEEDCVHALEWLADELGAAQQPIEPAKYGPMPLATGRIDSLTLAQSLGNLIPENAIVVDEGVSTGRGFFPSTRNAHPHTWLQNMGGSIGIGMPMATGAAVACPDRKVLNIQADGSAMYTIQSLWTQARENLNITTVLLNNKSYAILRHELANVGAQNVGRKALDMLDLSRPDLDFVGLARGMGVPGERVDTMEEFNKAVARGLAHEGPYLVEVMLG
jgi:acetolactate synthase-1/2/3 large subunit